MLKNAPCPFRIVRHRFRRWCRKGYAAFASLKRVVTIGCLAAHVSERFQTKYNALHRGGLQPATDRLTTGGEEDTGEPAMLPDTAGSYGYGYLLLPVAAAYLYSDDCGCTFLSVFRTDLSIKKAEGSRLKPGSLPLFLFFFPAFSSMTYLNNKRISDLSNDYK